MRPGGTGIRSPAGAVACSEPARYPAGPTEDEVGRLPHGVPELVFIGVYPCPEKPAPFTACLLEETEHPAASRTRFRYGNVPDHRADAGQAISASRSPRARHGLTDPPG